AMAKLRDALGDSAGRPRYIETIAKRGYRFLGKIEPEPQAASAIAPTASSSIPQPAPDNATQATIPTSESELPRAGRGTSRTLFILVQVMYLIFYLSALFDMQQLYLAAFALWPAGARAIFSVYLVTALVGVAVRLYLITATAFDYHLLHKKYSVLFPW